MSWTHIYGSLKECEDQTIPCYYETWPISLNTAKVNLKRSKELQAIEQRLITNKGPTIIVAVHLCGTLSLKAVHLFNNNPEVKFICLKPCCLPGKYTLHLYGISMTIFCIYINITACSTCVFRHGSCQA